MQYLNDRKLKLTRLFLCSSYESNRSLILYLDHKIERLDQYPSQKTLCYDAWVEK